jgi:choline dehydrogenase-like flavoprotein
MDGSLLQPQESKPQFDVIVVGSGAGGASVARELARKGNKVLILERGANTPMTDSLLRLAAVSDYVSVGDDVGMARAITTGGTTAVYFGVAEYPPLEAFRALGIDLSRTVEAVKQELPIAAPLRDELLGTQVIRVRDSARQLGIPWVKTEAMLIDETKCTSGFSYQAIWRARSYVDDAVSRGAVLLNGAKVRKVLVEGTRAVGVEYELRVRKRRETRRAYADRIVVAAGALASPLILRDSGITNVGDRGFYCDPGYMVMGYVKGLKGRDLFPGSMGTNTEEDGVLIGDGCMSRTLYRGYMLTSRQFRRVFSHRNNIAVGVMVRDGRSGELRADGRYHKQFTREETHKLNKAGEIARQIVRNAGAVDISNTGLSAAHVGGLIRIGEHLDGDLQTEYSHLHVCDCSVIPEDIRLTPALTLICLGKFLADRLASGIN